MDVVDYSLFSVTYKNSVFQQYKKCRLIMLMLVNTFSVEEFEVLTFLTQSLLLEKRIIKHFFQSNYKKLVFVG